MRLHDGLRPRPETEEDEYHFHLASERGRRLKERTNELPNGWSSGLLHEEEEKEEEARDDSERGRSEKEEGKGEFLRHLRHVSGLPNNLSRTVID